MPSSLWKDTLREIRKTLGRFFSIFAIVAIGVAFFAGVKASVPDMKFTADAYFDEFNLMDIRLVSTVGFTNEDIQAIQNLEGIEGVDATYTMEALTMVGSHQLTLKIHALPNHANAQDPNYINQANLQEGRMPEKSGECLVEVQEIRNSGLQIGDTITLTSGTDTNITENLKTKEYTIVGTTLSPNYLSYEKGTSSIGNGQIDNYIMILEDDFKGEYFSEVNVTVANAKEYNSYDDAYFDITDKIKTELENVGVKRSNLRFEEIKQIANDKYNEGLKTYEESKVLFEEEITKAKSVLEVAFNDILQGEATLAIEKEQYEQKVTDARSQIDTAKVQLQNGRVTLSQANKEFEQNKVLMLNQIAQLEAQIDTINMQLSQLVIQMTNIENQLKQPGLSENDKILLNQQLDNLKLQKASTESAKATLENAITEIRFQMQQIQQQLINTQLYLDDSEAQITNHEMQLKQGESIALEQFTKAERELSEGRNQYDSGKSSMLEQEQKGQEELALAKEKLDKAKLDIAELPQPEWYVLDRESHYSYMDYGSVADRMDGIAKVFPVFFFLVAALVCLTTMTRMVEEQRSMIGTMKALGYGKSAIAFKYVFYALIASFFGSIVGCIIGMYIFPKVIFSAWALMYTLPNIKFVMQPTLAFVSSFLVITITIAAAYAAVYKELIEVPSQLMRPKAPKVGKKILLERIPIIWKRFSFTQKVTARNIFRYKKRFLMTVIGISGCTALLVAGFGIQDSIGEVVSKQYGDILQYDVSINFDKNATLNEKETILHDFKLDNRFEGIMGVSQLNGTIHDEEETEPISIMVPSDTEEFKEFVSLHTRVGQDEVALSDNHVLISEKLSMNIGVAKGDTIIIDDGDEILREVVVGGIVENYIGHYVYMSPKYYQDIFHSHQENNALIAKLMQDDSSIEEQLGNEIMDNDQIASVSFYSGVAENFQETISSLGFVVIVLIIAAGMLAFVVLYNLTNVNISERIREIATIKVLGFYDKEVSAYVYRENIFLTIIGAFFGLLLGIGLHRLIMNLAEMDSVMFGRNITWISFLLSFMITMIFAIIVNLFMYRKLKDVPMVESLKSIE